MNTASFEQQLSYGQEGEHIVGGILIGSGFSVMPLYQFTASAAPQIYNASGSLVSPDLMAFKCGSVIYVESKRKRQWTHYNGKVETGFNFKHYKAYKQLADTTGLPLFVFFVHENEEPHGIYFMEINQQEPRYWNGKTPTGRYITQPEAFFTSESLTRIR